MSARTKARKRALDVLFEADQKAAPLAEIFAARKLLTTSQTPLPPYAEQIITGVIDQWQEINTLIAEYSPDWTLDRMPSVDRAILRIAVWEILANSEVDDAVAIAEATKLATDLSTDDSPRYINGVLGAIVRAR